MTICWHTDCTNKARHTIVTGQELCDLHLAVLRALHDQRTMILDDGLDGDPKTDLPPVEAAIKDLLTKMVIPVKDGDASGKTHR